MKAFLPANGIAVSRLTALALLLASPAAAQAPYGIGSFYLGDSFSKSADARKMRCVSSQFFSTHRWCRRTQRLNGRRGRYAQGTSVMHNSDGRIVYMSRALVPAHFARNGVKTEINRLSRLYGKARILASPRRVRPNRGIIAYWGNVTLAALDQHSRRVLASGRSPRKGLLIDYLGDLRKSVRLGLPVYAYRGGAGFVWRAALDENGRGRLRFTAVDASTFMSSAISLKAAAARRRNAPSSKSEFSTAPRRSEFSTAPRRSGADTARRSNPPPRANSRRVARAAPPVRKRSRSSSGTGFFINKGGMLVTNAHVVNKCTEVMVKYRTDPAVKATVLARDRRNDLAILKTGINAQDIPALRLKLDLGEPVAAFGYPLASLLSKSGNFSLGNVTSLAGLSDDTRKVQISVPVQPGNSGGPLLDYNGNVVGVVTSKLNALKTAAITGDVPQNVNFAIKSSIVSNFLDSNGASYSTKVLDKKMTTTDLAKKAKLISVFITCR